MTGRSLVIHLARGVGLPTAKHSKVKLVPTGTLIVCENEAIRAGARVLVDCVTSDVGSPSPIEVDAVTQKSYFWFSTKLRASKVTGYPCSSTRTMLPN